MPKERVMISKLRCSNLKIPIEFERWYNIQKKENLCQTNVENEYHYILECHSQAVIDIRHTCIRYY